MEKTIPSRVFLTLLKEGKRLQDLVDQGAQLLNNPIMFADHDHQPQAFSVNYPADDVQDRMHAQLNSAELNKKALDKIADPIPFLSQNPAFRRRHLVCKAIWNDRWIGTLMIPEVEYSLENLDLELVRTIADACAIAGMLELETAAVDQRRPTVYVFNDLIDDRIANASALEKRLAGGPLTRFFPYRVIHVHSAEYENDPRFQSVMTAQLRARPEVDWIFRARGRVFLLCEGEQLPLALTQFLIQLHDQYGFVYGVSDCAQDLWKLKWMVQEAVTTTRFAVYAERKQAIHNYDDYKFYAVADLAEPEQWENYLTVSFKGILDYDAKNGTEYLKTIQYYLVNDANLQKASEAMFMHKNTLVYRMKRIRELFGVDLEVNKDLLKLYFSFALYKLHQFRSRNLDH